jgi:hypothetical protein
MNTTFILTVLTLIFSINNPTQTDYLTKYAGAYNVIDGVEAFTLKSDGSAMWVYGWVEGGKVKTTQKYGSWSARQGYIKIEINGNTGSIVEEYEFKGGKFRSKEDYSRYLVKR